MQDIFLTNSLFNEVVIDNTQAEGIKYIGSKDKIIPYIMEFTYKLQLTIQ